MLITSRGTNSTISLGETEKIEIPWSRHHSEFAERTICPALNRPGYEGLSLFRSLVGFDDPGAFEVFVGRLRRNIGVSSDLMRKILVRERIEFLTVDIAALFAADFFS